MKHIIQVRKTQQRLAVNSWEWHNYYETVIKYIKLLKQHGHQDRTI